MPLRCRSTTQAASAGPTRRSSDRRAVDQVAGKRSPCARAGSPRSAPRGWPPGPGPGDDRRWRSSGRGGDWCEPGGRTRRPPRRSRAAGRPPPRPCPGPAARPGPRVPPRQPAVLAAGVGRQAGGGLALGGAPGPADQQQAQLGVPGLAVEGAGQVAVEPALGDRLPARGPAAQRRQPRTREAVPISGSVRARGRVAQGSASANGGRLQEPLADQPAGRDQAARLVQQPGQVGRGAAVAVHQPAHSPAPAPAWSGCGRPAAAPAGRP